MKEIIRNFLIKIADKFLSYMSDNICTITTVVGAGGFIVQTWFPSHLVDYTSIVSAYLIHKKG